MQLAHLSSMVSYCDPLHPLSVKHCTFMTFRLSSGQILILVFMTLGTMGFLFKQIRVCEGRCFRNCTKSVDKQINGFGIKMNNLSYIVLQGKVFIFDIASERPTPIFFT